MVDRDVQSEYMCHIFESLIAPLTVGLVLRPRGGTVRIIEGALV